MQRPLAPHQHDHGATVSSRRRRWRGQALVLGRHVGAVACAACAVSADVLTANDPHNPTTHLQAGDHRMDAERSDQRSSPALPAVPRFQLPHQSSRRPAGLPQLQLIGADVHAAADDDTASVFNTTATIPPPSGKKLLVMTTSPPHMNPIAAPVHAAGHHHPAAPMAACARSPLPTAPSLPSLSPLPSAAPAMLDTASDLGGDAGSGGSRSAALSKSGPRRASRLDAGDDGNDVSAPSDVVPSGSGRNNRVAALQQPQQLREAPRLDASPMHGRRAATLL